MKRPSWARILVYLPWWVVWAASGATAQANPALPDDERLLIGAARDLAAEIAERVWPGWGETPMEVLLVGAEREVLIGSERLPHDFEPAGDIESLGAVATRPRVFPPTLLATMPAFGPPPTIVVGTPSATRRASGEWVRVLLHEHFHQWQMRGSDYFVDVDALDLAAGDTTGRWMLEYPFPYADPIVGQELGDLSRELARLLRRPEADDLHGEAEVFWRHFAAVIGALGERDARYLAFQLWQEGVALFVEMRVAEEAAGGWQVPEGLASQPDYEDFGVAACTAWEELFAELEAADLAGRRRLLFYSMGAGMAFLLDRTEPGWKGRYESPRFALPPSRDAD